MDVLEQARRQLGISALWSHEETGNAWTFARDRRVAAWARNGAFLGMNCLGWSRQAVTDAQGLGPPLGGAHG